MVRTVFAALLSATVWQSPAYACPATDSVLHFGQTETASLRAASSHPLTGRVVRTARPWKPEELATPTCQRYTELSEFLRGAAYAYDTSEAILVLGEIHDNPLHHRLRAAIVAFLGDPPVGNGAIVFEQFRADQQEALDQFNRAPASIAELKRLTGWEQSGWPDLYDPLFTSAVGARLPLYAGDAARAEIKTAARQGASVLSAAEHKRLALDLPLGAANDAASAKEIVDAHCGMLPGKAIPAMAFAQRLRDARLADATLAAANRHRRAILIAGNGHARADRGVAWYIRQRAPRRQVISVLLVEVEEGKTDPAAYIPLGPDGKAAADYVIFTPGQPRGDPCEGMTSKASP